MSVQPSPAQRSDCPPPGQAGDLLSRLLGVLEDLLDLLGELILSVGKLLDLDFVVVLLNGIEADVNLVDNRLDLLLG